jgi:DNA repair protein RecO (recombination protein O)
MPGNFKTEAIVLRSIRFGEADRILHLYTAERGRVNAIAKGSRRPKSRFGGRLEPFFRLDLMLHEGRSELCTVTGAATVDGFGDLRSDGGAIDAAARGCDAVLRLLDSAEPNRPAYNLLCRYLEMLDENARHKSADRPHPRAAGLAFRLKLALAAGFSPELGACARCGEREGIVSFSGAAGGVVCGSCEAGGFPISADAHRFMVVATGRPVVELPAASDAVLRQVERAIGDTLSHHAHVNLRAVA